MSAHHPTVTPITPKETATMTSDRDQNRDDRDALLTAYALDAVTPEERAVVERLLADSDAGAASRHVAEVRATAAALRAARDEEMVERSADLRRAVLAAAVGGGSGSAAGRHGAVTPVAPVTSSRSPWRARWAVAVGSCAAVAAVLFALFGPGVRGIVEAPRREVALAPADGASEPAVAKPEGRGSQGAPAPTDHPFVGREQPQADAVRVVTVVDVEDRLESLADKGLKVIVERSANAEVPVTDRLMLGAGVNARAAAGGEPAGSERYNRFADSRFLPVLEQPLSTFSIDVDTASYANVRRFLTSGQRPPRDAVRIEELVNYFRYDYPQPKGDEPFSVAVEAAACPWKAGHRLVRVGLAGRDVARDARPAGNLVFLVDVSGSMDEPDKLPLVQRALAMLVDELTENDRVSIVTYAGNAGLVLPSTSGDQKDKIRAAIEGLRAGGSTHGSAGIVLAYEQAAERFIKGGANRVILCTDGDLNVGVTSDEALVDLITKQAKGGTFLTVLGFGTGNLQDEKMEKLADNGNGVYVYIDGVREARKVLVEQLTGSTITIAKDVKIQVEFNPAQVASYRLLGYENRALAAEDFRDDRKDAGEIGAGHTVTALYEIVPVGAEAAGPAAGRGAEPLKYQPAPPAATPAAQDKPPFEQVGKPAIAGPTSRELLTVKLRWKRPDGDASTLVETPLAEQGGRFDAAPADFRFAAAVAAFGMILRDSEHKGTATLPLVAEIAGSALGRDAGGYRAEFLDLVRKAAGLSAAAGQSEPRE
jgi:secreted protein with Ig-like and vWFA domain